MGNLDMTKQIEHLHALFVQLTGRDLPLDACGYRYSQWMDWIRFGGGDEHKLRVVVAYVKKGIREGKRHDGALKFQNLIVDWPRFADDYAEACQWLKAQEAEKRGRIDKGKAQVLRDTGRAVDTGRPARTAGDIASEVLKCKEGFEKLRASL